MKNIAILLLGYCSYFFYKLVVKLTKNTRKAAFWQQSETQSKSNSDIAWHSLSRWLTKGKSNLLAMMMMGPRWNCNATLAISDMFYVENEIDIDIQTANSSAKFWTAVVYDMNFKTIAYLGNDKDNMNDTNMTLALPTGHYFIAIRYYETSIESEFPRVNIDANAAIDAVTTKEERVEYEKYLEGLSNYRSFLFLAMHYHAYAFLKNRQSLRADWVNQVYLPVGNPETKFTYGTVKKGQKIQVASVEYPQKRTYISVYNKASLPVYWGELFEGQETPAIPVSGTYAIRQIANRSISDETTALEVNLV